MDWAPILPRLARFYPGAEPDWWKVPIGRLTFYMEQQPMIEAEEKLSRAQVISVGNGLYKRHTIRRITREWRNLARPEGQVQKPRSKAEFMASMAGLRIDFQEVPRE